MSGEHNFIVKVSRGLGLPHWLQFKCILMFSVTARHVTIAHSLTEGTGKYDNLCLIIISNSWFLIPWNCLMTTFGWLNTKLVSSSSIDRRGWPQVHSEPCAVGGSRPAVLLCSVFWFKLSSDKKAVYVLLRNLIWVHAENWISDIFNTRILEPGVRNVRVTKHKID